MTTIRRAEPRDAERIGEVWYRAWADGHEGNVPDALLPHRRPEHFARRAAERVPRSWVAEVDRQVVGFVTVHEDELEQLFVAAEARGTDVARSLLAAGCDAIAAADHPVAWLAVVAGNARARAFYAREGWVDSGDLAYEASTEEGPITIPTRRYERRLGSPDRIE